MTRRWREGEEGALECMVSRGNCKKWRKESDLHPLEVLMGRYVAELIWKLKALIPPSGVPVPCVSTLQC